jgi:type VI secretion system secreted protein Hcp
MALNAYLKLTGAKQGEIKGSTPKGKGKGSDGIEISEFSFGVEAPRDSQSGLPTGQRKHNPIVITREVDAASPLLFQALCTNEVFKTALIEFDKVGTGGKASSIRTIELINGRISSITHAPNHSGKRSERISFDYEQVLVNGLSNVVIPHSV